MIRTGLLGESQNDIEAIKALMEKKYQATCSFHSILPRKMQDGEIDRTTKLTKLIAANLNDKTSFAAAIIMRDLDADEIDIKQIAARNKWFNALKHILPSKSVFLLYIYELEALIMADIDAFNQHYKANYNF